MRTMIFLFGAAALFGLVQGMARWLSFAPHLATLAFLLIWLLVASFNMWFGVTRAGYLWTEEWPIFVLIFGLPAALVLAVQWQWGG